MGLDNKYKECRYNCTQVAFTSARTQQPIFWLISLLVGLLHKPQRVNLIVKVTSRKWWCGQKINYE